MKRTLTALLTLTLILALCASAFAAAPGAGTAHGRACGVGRLNGGSAFTDADQDGVCDNAGSRCEGYVDEDNDGVCDHRDASKPSSAACGQGAGSGMRQSHRGCRR